MTNVPTGAAAEHFRAVAPMYMRMFMADFGVTELDAAAVFGNAGYESLGFTLLQEVKPSVERSRGGWGWFQWTGPRRKAFEAYCRRNDFDPSDDLANYKFLFVELIGSEKGALPKLKAADTLEEKVVAFETSFERAGVKAYAKRQAWARLALEALRGLGETAASPAPAPVPPPPADDPPPVPGGAPGARPSWLVLAIIIGLAALVGAGVWFLGRLPDTSSSVMLLGDAPVPHDRPVHLSGSAERNIWAEIGLQVLLSFVGPIISAAAAAAVSWIVYWWGRILKADFDKKSADSLHAALERGMLAAIEVFGGRANKAQLVSGAADYAEQWNGGTVKRLGLTRADLEALALPHVATAKAKVG